MNVVELYFYITIYTNNLDRFSANINCSECLYLSANIERCYCAKVEAWWHNNALPLARLNRTSDSSNRLHVCRGAALCPACARATCIPTWVPNNGQWTSNLFLHVKKKCMKIAGRYCHICHIVFFFIIIVFIMWNM